MRRLIPAIVLAVVFAAGTMVFAEGKGGGHHHPNLQAAHKLLGEALEKINAAQKANEYDMDGHAAKAKELLEQAQGELKQAAEAAEKNKDEKPKGKG